jgi:hypothetical protein
MAGASVQRGLTTLVHGSSVAMVSIPAIDISKSFLLSTQRAGNRVDGIESRYQVRGRITGATELTFDRISSLEPVEIAWEVVSLNDGSTVQSGNIAIASTATSGTATISSVAVEKSVSFISVRGGSGTLRDNLDETSFRHTLTNGTTLTVTREGTGTAADVSWFVVQFHQTPVPPTPLLASPAHGATDISTTPTLSWNTSAGASSYRLQVSTSSDFSTTVFDQGGITTTSQSVSGLSTSTSYYWRVNATNAAGSSNWSTVWSFTTVPPPPETPSQSVPEDAAVEVSPWPFFSWDSSSNATAYRLQILQGSTVIFDDSTVTTTAREVGFLQEQMTYSWRVGAKNAGGWSSFSSPTSFTTGIRPPLSGRVDAEDIALYAAIDSFDVYLKTGSSSALTFVEEEYQSYLVRLDQPINNETMFLVFNGHSYEMPNFVTNEMTTVYESNRELIRQRTSDRIHEAGGREVSVEVPLKPRIFFYQVNDTTGWLQIVSLGIKAEFMVAGVCRFTAYFDLKVRGDWKLTTDATSYQMEIGNMKAEVPGVRLEGKPRYWWMEFVHPISVGCRLGALITQAYLGIVEAPFKAELEGKTREIFNYTQLAAKEGITPELVREAIQSFPIRFFIWNESDGKLSVGLNFLEGRTPGSTEFVGLQPLSVVNPSLDYVGYNLQYRKPFENWTNRPPCYTDSDPFSLDCYTILFDKMREINTQSLHLRIPWEVIVGDLTYEQKPNPDLMTQVELDQAVSNLLTKAGWASFEELT